MIRFLRLLHAGEKSIHFPAEFQKILQTAGRQIFYGQDGIENERSVFRLSGVGFLIVTFFIRSAA